MKKIILTEAFVLHRRPYRETSYLIDLFTKGHGRVTVLAKGVKKARSAHAGLLQPFNPLWISCSGRGELLVLSHAEMRGSPNILLGEVLYAGFYLNELLMTLLHKWDTYERLFHVYEQALQALSCHQPLEQILRAFEMRLLEELGYAVLPKLDQAIEQAFLPECFYRFDREQGWVLEAANAMTSQTCFAGETLIAIAKEDWQNAACLRDAKRLIRLVLTPLLGMRPLHSRKLFLQFEEK